MIADLFLDFTTFVDGEILPATADIANLKEENRKHLQKLVYTNLVDRFDSTVDTALLESCRSEALLAIASKKLTDQVVTEAAMLAMLMQADTIQEAINTRLKSVVRADVLRNRHSQKLCTLFSALQPHQDKARYLKVPRVHIAKGWISKKTVKVTDKKIPRSICGYADWLYSRRNVVVHGAGNNNLLDNDKNKLKELYDVDAATSIKIKPGSITNAATFYKAVLVELRP